MREAKREETQFWKGKTDDYSCRWYCTFSFAADSTRKRPRSQSCLEIIRDGLSVGGPVLPCLDPVPTFAETVIVPTETTMAIKDALLFGVTFGVKVTSIGDVKESKASWNQ